MIMKVKMLDVQKCTLPLLFSDFDFFANLQGRFIRFTNLALLTTDFIKYKSFCHNILHFKRQKKTAKKSKQFLQFLI